MKDNKLIAEFMDWKLQDNPKERWHNSYRTSNGILHKNTNTDPLLFHSSWDWLMPVVDKIESFEDDNRCCKYNVKIEQCWTEIIDNKTSDRIVLVDADDKKLSTFKAIVVFIKRIKKNT